VTQFGIIRKAALYAGHAPATVELFCNLWYAKGLPDLGRGRRFRLESSLFDESE